MTHDTSIWSFVLNASAVVKCVMLLLLAASLASWTIIFERYRLFKNAERHANAFERRFWSGTNLNSLAQSTNTAAPTPETETQLETLFNAGFSAFQKNMAHAPKGRLMATERALRVAHSQASDALEQHLSFLATVGSTSPYIGLFGTVWGIMTAFQALGSAGQATIAMVAPGISEALIATAIGLFAAIPAVIAYNRFSSQLTRINDRFERFQDELLGILAQHHEET